MSKNENIKRVGLYFNLENEYDNKMYAFISNGGKKPKDEIKKLISMAMEGIDIQPVEIKSTLKQEDLSSDDIDPGIGVGF